MEGELKSLQEQMKGLEQEYQHLVLNTEENQGQMRSMAEKIDERDDVIEQLEYELEDLRKKNRHLFKEQMRADGKFKREESSVEIDPVQVQALLQENEELHEAVQKLKDELDYGKQRENKLMFFLYILKEKGYPISQVFEAEIKDIATTRFSTDFDDEYKVMYAQIKAERAAERRDPPVSERAFMLRRARGSILGEGNMKIPYVGESDLSDSNCIPVTMKKAENHVRPEGVPKLALEALK
mmetsp:Transcript_14516/g.10464  ORF Transcript_14516/g.10464 Transcript_14516/m.10464 type:complete len:240 (-) Transcript_14516:250-969(-)